MAHSIQRHFANLPDPRRAQGRRHALADLLVIAVCAVICAADSWADVADFGKAKRKWFKTFLDPPHGMPCQDTFERVFARLDPDAFEACFMAWTRELAGTSGGQLLAIDGKTIRRSFAHAWNHSTATHLVSAFVSANATVFAQLAVDMKENEITAIPKLLALLDLQDAVVTIDAIGCQRAIAQQIIAGGGHYVLAVKDNQPTLARKLENEFQAWRLDGFKGTWHDHHPQIDGDHGRIETRNHWAVDDLAFLGEEAQRWPGLKTAVLVEARRQVAGGTDSIQRRYYISSLPAHAEHLAACIRGHWGIENRLHYVLDVSFAEDAARQRRGHSAQNFARLRRIALNLLRRDTTRKRGIKGQRLNAAWDHDYLLKLLTG
jgi:predicted transposase YbfD/YdcC